MSLRASRVNAAGKESRSTENTADIADFLSDIADFLDRNSSFGYINFPPPASRVFEKQNLRKDPMIESTFAAAPLTTSWIAVNFSSQFLPSRAQQSSSPSSPKQTSVRHSARGRWALVVDDVPDVTEVLSLLLIHAGYEVSTASSARDAIALAQGHHFDVVISDIGMPEMNGYELVRALRTMPGYEAVPMVAVTGYSMFDDRNRSLNAGFNEHMVKPIDPRAFLDLIEQL